MIPSWLKLVPAILLVTLACDPVLTDDPIPLVPFDDIQVNLFLPEYTSLNTNGGTAYLNEGVRGIIIYRVNNQEYIAYERNCSFHPNEACSTVDVHPSGLYLVDSCCGSTFSITTGEPTGGPAWRPLLQYETFLQGQYLVITDTPVIP